MNTKLKSDICVTSHTLGPWEQNPKYPDEILGPDGKTIAEVSGGHFVGDYSSPTYEVPPKTMANSRAITACPDLYLGCEAVLVAADGGDWERAIQLCRDAIRKARGVR